MSGPVEEAERALATARAVAAAFPDAERFDGQWTSALVVDRPDARVTYMGDGSGGLHLYLTVLVGKTEVWQRSSSGYGEEKVDAYFVLKEIVEGPAAEAICEVYRREVRERRARHAAEAQKTSEVSERQRASLDQQVQKQRERGK